MDYLTAFLLMGAVDICWALYARRTSQGKALEAGMYSAGIALFSAVTTVMVVADNMKIIPVVLAAFLFTWAAVRWDEGRSA